LFDENDKFLNYQSDKIPNRLSLKETVGLDQNYFLFLKKC